MLKLPIFQLTLSFFPIQLLVHKQCFTLCKGRYILKNIIKMIQNLNLAPNDLNNFMKGSSALLQLVHYKAKHFA